MTNSEEFYAAVLKANPSLIAGVGTTPAEAIADAQDKCARAYIEADESDYDTKQCTKAHFRKALSTPWYLKSGKIGTEEEYKAEQEAARDPRNDLEIVAWALFGSEWISPLARELGVGRRTVQRWAYGETAVPNWLSGKLAALARKAVDAGVLDSLEEQAKIIRKAAASRADFHLGSGTD